MEDWLEEDLDPPAPPLLLDPPAPPPTLADRLCNLVLNVLEWFFFQFGVLELDDDPDDDVDDDFAVKCLTITGVIIAVIALVYAFLGW